MSEILTDLITPKELTGFTREALADYEQAKGTLLRFLPNTEVPDTRVTLRPGQSGLIPEAAYRAWNAEPEIRSVPGAKRVTVDLQPLGINIPVSEYDRLRARNNSDNEAQNLILKAATYVARSVSDALEQMRGQVLVNGKATITNLGVEADFGRDERLAPTVAKSWKDETVSVLDDLRAWWDLYSELNGEEPGAIVTSTEVARAIARTKDFRVPVVTGDAISASRERVNTVLLNEDMPFLTIYDRQTVSPTGEKRRVIPKDRVLFLPAPVDPNAAMETDLGGTFWGVSDCATDPDWDIAPEEQAGIVTAVLRESKKPGHPTEVVSDAIAVPILANANLALCAKVFL